MPLAEPSEGEPAAIQRIEQLAAALQHARAALAADRKTDLAIALHTLTAASEPLLDTRASQEPATPAGHQANDTAPADMPHRRNEACLS